eukprot:2352448-Pleurochrysis_carterae.AAC.2
MESDRGGVKDRNESRQKEEAEGGASVIRHKKGARVGICMEGIGSLARRCTGRDGTVGSMRRTFTSGETNTRLVSHEWTSKQLWSNLYRR